MDRISPHDTHCFFLGVSEYSESNFHNLPAAENNTNKLLEILIKDHGYKYSHVNVFTDEIAHKDMLRSKIRSVVEKNQDLKTIIFYFAGHGEFDSKQRFSMILKETPLNDLYKQGLSPAYLNEDVFSELNEINRKELNFIIVIDCCYSQNVVKKFNQLSQYVITSSPVKEPSIYYEGKEHSEFTGELLDILENGIPGAGEELTLDDIFDELSNQLDTKSLKPQRERNGELGDIPFVKNKAFNKAISSKFNDHDKKYLRQVFDKLCKHKPELAEESGLSLELMKRKILNEYPYIISYHLKNILPLDPNITQSHLKDFFEQITELLSFSYLAQYLEVNQKHIPGIHDQVLNLDASKGISLIDDLIPHLKKSKKPLVFDEVDNWSNNLSKLLKETAELFEKNKASIDDLYKQIIELVSQLSFFSKYVFISVRLIDVDYRKYSKHALFVHEASLLQGESLKPYSRKLEVNSSDGKKEATLNFREPKYSNSILLSKSSDLELNQFLNLWPFLIDCTAYNHRDDDIKDNPEIRLFCGKEDGKYNFKPVDLMNKTKVKYFKEIDVAYSREEVENHFKAFEKQLA